MLNRFSHDRFNGQNCNCDKRIWNVVFRESSRNQGKIDMHQGLRMWKLSFILIVGLFVLEKTDLC